jgi:ectoine hydroxylase-related dioxygenase (phytanoyl-CoA dioxygenase family)
MWYVPGSHRWGLVSKPSLAGELDALFKNMSEEQRTYCRLHAVCVPTRAGEAIFHHPLTLHASRENTSENPRRAVVVNLCADGVCSASNTELLQNVPIVPKGQPLNGQFFPLLYDISAGTTVTQDAFVNADTNDNTAV